MKCSECGGKVESIQYAIFCPNGDTSGEHKCQKCGRSKKWFNPGNGEPVIDMSDVNVATGEGGKE